MEHYDNIASIPSPYLMFKSQNNYRSSIVNTDNNEINKISKDIGLDYVQLHGDEDEEDIFKIKLPCIKALDGNSPNLSENINIFKNTLIEIRFCYH